MYYEEKIVNGVLCSRKTPQGIWVPISIEQISQRVVIAEKRVKQLEGILDEANGIL